MKNSCASRVGALLAIGAGLAAVARGGVGEGVACLQASDLVCAQAQRDALLRLSPDSTEALQLDMLTRFYEGDFSGALELQHRLEGKGVQMPSLPPIEKSALAREGYQAGEALGVRVRYSPGVDQILVAEALDTLQSCRQTFDPLLGGGPKHEILLDIYPDGSRFIDASSLPGEAVRKTGVVALSKWTRLLLTSPRARGHGYAWKDTIAHEYIHLVVAWRTRDQAPVWLQEGLARYLEGRWRGADDQFLSVDQQSQLAGALRTGKFVPLQKFKSSMAYLDSGEEAALAFAQVSSQVAMLVELKGDKVLPRLLDRVRAGDEPQQAFAEAAGFKGWDAFEASWKIWLTKLPLVETQLAALPTVLDGEGGDFADDPFLAGRMDLARFVRVGDLLREAGRPDAALVEYDKAVAALEEENPGGPPSPVIISRLAASHQALGNRDVALELVEEGAELYPEFTPFQVRLGDLRREAGDIPGAVDAWSAAHDLNPFDPFVQQDLVDGYTALGDTDRAAVHAGYLGLLRSGGLVVAERAE